MNLRGTLLSVAAILMAVGINAQRANRTELCQVIPDLTVDQKQKIDKLSVAHQNKMDGLRTQFYSESDGVKASGFKTQMNTEMQTHYQNISGLLTPEQQTWYDQNCNVNNRRSNYYTTGYGRGQGFVRGQAYGLGQGYVRGQGYGRGQVYVRGQGYGRGQGFGRGQGYGRGMGRGQGRLIY